MSSFWCCEAERYSADNERQRPDVPSWFLIAKPGGQKAVDMTGGIWFRGLSSSGCGVFFF